MCLLVVSSKHLLQGEHNVLTKWEKVKLLRDICVCGWKTTDIWVLIYGSHTHRNPVCACVCVCACYVCMCRQILTWQLVCIPRLNTSEVLKTLLATRDRHLINTHTQGDSICHWAVNHSSWIRGRGQKTHLLQRGLPFLRRQQERAPEFSLRPERDPADLQKHTHTPPREKKTPGLWEVWILASENTSRCT